MTTPELELETFIETDCPFHAAGRRWTIPEVRYTRLPDGSTGVDGEELDRIHRAVANEVCGEADTLSSTELDFLSDLTGATLADLAAFLHVDKSTVSRWRSGSRGVPHSAGWLLKRWFWYQLFGEGLTATRVALRRFERDVAFLSFIREQAISHGLTFAVRPHRRSDADAVHA